MKCSLALFIIISPGEERIAKEGLQRALALVPENYSIHSFIFNNTGNYNLFEGISGGDSVKVTNVPKAPRPYNEIGKTVFWCLEQMADEPFDLLVKLDPDTVVLNPRFFEDLVSLHELEGADFAAPHAIYRARGDNVKRWLRLLIDCLPVGISRGPAADRYGKAGKIRVGRTWHARSTFLGLVKCRWPYAQPTGGGYTIGRKMLNLMHERGFLHPIGKNGLEWNDDVIIPILVRALGGKVVDIRKTRFEEGWKFMHGARYFTVEDINNNLRAVHPLKETEEDWSIRSAIPGKFSKSHV